MDDAGRVVTAAPGFRSWSAVPAGPAIEIPGAGTLRLADAVGERPDRVVTVTELLPGDRRCLYAPSRGRDCCGCRRATATS